MMPIANYNETKIKIYSTNKGIKIVDSPIKIQILNILEGEVSEAEIVRQTNKSKSTISVHLKNLIDEGIISFRSHPLDKRSKLFYIYANYIGEIYPDRIIYKLPEMLSDINTEADLYIEELRQLKSMSLIHGLQLEPLEIKTGELIGKKIFENLEFETLDELVDSLCVKFESLNIGTIKIASTNPLILKNYDCNECFNVQYNIPTCNMTKGILKGIFTKYYGEEVSVEEVECKSKMDDSCTFIVNL